MSMHCMDDECSVQRLEVAMLPFVEMKLMVVALVREHRSATSATLCGAASWSDVSCRVRDSFQLAEAAMSCCCAPQGS